MMKIKKGDTVVMRSGSSRGKSGKVLSVLPRAGKVLVEGLNLVTAHRKPRTQGAQGQTVRIPRSVPASTVMIVCPQCKKAARIGFRLLEDGRKERYCHTCKATIGKN